MQTRMFFVFLIVFAVALCPLYAEDAPLPGEKEYNAAVEKIKADADAKLKMARDTFVAKLKAEMAARTKAGDLDGAMKVKEQIAALEDGKPYTGSSIPDNSKSVSQPDTISLTTLKPKATTVGWDRFRINETCEGKNDPVAIEGKAYSEWIFAHANSEIIYDIPPGMRFFHAIGHSFDRKEIIFSVQFDGVDVFKSKVLNSYPQEHFEAILPIPQKAKTISLITTFAPKNNYDGKRSAWIAPEFSKNNPQPLLKSSR